MVRWTKWQDRDEIRNLWQLRFGDSESFLDWFFRERFSPDHSAVSVEDGRVVSSIQSYPFHIKMRGGILPCAVIAGVSTLPAYEGRGHMGRTMRFYMNGISARGGIVIPYRPEILSMYEGFGHYPVSRTAYVQVSSPSAVFPDGSMPAVPLDLRRDVSAMHACYYRFTQRYSGILSRSLADMRLKLADYASDGAHCLGIFTSTGLGGYCIYFNHGDIYAEEFVANDRMCEHALFQALCSKAAKSRKSVGGKLPPDTGVQGNGITFDVRPMGVMGVADVAGLLSATGGSSSYRVAVTDQTVAANNGVFDFAGNRCSEAPHIRLPAGRLVQFLCGYCSLEELAADGQAVFLDAGAARELDEAFPRQTCYIVDEY